MASGMDSGLIRCTFEWKIENINHCWWLKKSEKIDSPDFIAYRLGGTKWSLSLHPLGHTADKSISLYLNREKSRLELEVIEVYYKLAFLGKDGSILTEKTSQKSSFKENETQGFSMFEDRETVFVSSREIFLPEDTLTMQCTLWSHQSIPHQRVIKSGPEYIYARSVFRVNRKYFHWTIEKISSLESAHRKSYEDDSIDFDILFNEKDSLGKRENCGIREYSRSDLEMGTLSFKLPRFETFIENKGQYFPDGVLSFEFIFTTVDCTHTFDHHIPSAFRF